MSMPHESWLPAVTARPGLTNNTVPVLAQPRRGSWRPIRRRAWWCPTWWLLGWASGSPSAPGPPYASSTLRLWNTYRTSTSQHRCITLYLVRSYYWAFYFWGRPLGWLRSFVFNNFLWNSLLFVLNQSLDRHPNLFETCFQSHLVII